MRRRYRRCRGRARVRAGAAACFDVRSEIAFRTRLRRRRGGTGERCVCGGTILRARCHRLPREHRRWSRPLRLRGRLARQPLWWRLHGRPRRLRREPNNERRSALRLLESVGREGAHLRSQFPHESRMDEYRQRERDTQPARARCSVDRARPAGTRGLCERAYERMRIQDTALPYAGRTDR
jgi:hypothetical protein